MMKRYLATLLLIFAFLASGCNEQEPKDMPPLQTEKNFDKSMTLPKKDSNSEETSTSNESPDAKRNSTEEIFDKTSSSPQNGEQSSPQNGEQSSPQNGEQSSPQNGEQSSPQNGEQSNPQDGEQSNPQDGGQSNPQDGGQSNPPVEPVEPTPPPPSFLEENMIPIMVGMAIVIALLTITIFVQRNKLKRKKSSQPPPIVSPEPNKPSGSPNSTTPSLPPPIFANNDNISSKRLAFLVGTLQNIGKREEQQDSFCVSNSRDEQALRQKGLMAVVADGMGGLEGGAKISKLVANTFLQSYTRQVVSSTANFLYNTASTAEKEVEKLIEREGITGGSTLVAIMIKNYELNFISVGDSHIYLFQNGILTQLNREHNYGAVLKEKAARNEVSPEEPYRNSQRHSLTAYIGMGSFNIVDKNSHPIPLKPGDKVFLCSDGVYNALGDDALTTLLKSDALTAAKKIETNVLSQNLPKQDNFTGVIVELYEK